jgi:hypothetical protein
MRDELQRHREPSGSRTAPPLLCLESLQSSLPTLTVAIVEVVHICGGLILAVEPPQRKCEGRKRWAELKPELVREAKRLRRRSPKGHQRSLRDIAAELSKLGFVNERGAEFSASSIASIIAN